MSQAYSEELKELLLTVAKEQASDLHISVGKHPTLRVSRELVPLVKKPVVTPEDARGIVFEMLDEAAQKKLLEEKELDFSYNFEDKVRFRVNAFFERGFLSAALRLVPVDIKGLKELNLPEVLRSVSRGI